jgi:hypothetical protein
LFWKQLASITIKNFKIYSTSGLYGFKSTFKVVRDVISSGDTLLIAMDNIQSPMTYAILKEFGIISLLKGCEMHHTSYYCFEEYFISFSDVALWGNCTNAAVLKIRSIILNSIYKGESYYSLSEFINAISSAGSKFNFITDNRERFASQLLSYLTTYSGKCFRIIKKEFGKCWLSDCETEKVKCNKCPLLNNPMTALDKAMYILNNSRDLLDGCDITQIDPL